MISRLGFRSVFGGVTRCRLMTVTNGPIAINVRRYGDVPPQPFSNMPFKIRSRFAATLFFSIFFGIGLWAPFIIVWYSMAKKTF